MTPRTLALMLSAVVVLAACSREEPNADANAGLEQSNLGGQWAENSIGFFNNVIGDRVFFATDSSVLDAAARATLDAQAGWLRANPGATAVVEGHADERGTQEYNLGLGARRANSAYNYLISQGVEAGRLRTVTFGKERPEATCSDESCWSQNRRSVSVVANAPAS
ncbi:MAG: peptidoglycan-associated lipoprotein Pal [Pseudomonadota bacterium]